MSSFKSGEFQAPRNGENVAYMTKARAVCLLLEGESGLYRSDPVSFDSFHEGFQILRS
jgi:hypothetical protein